MSRKTNKTNHVLSLLSNGVKAEEEKEAKQEQEIKEEKETKKEQQSSVSVVKKTEDDVAEDIRRSLEKEMAEYEAARKTTRDVSEELQNNADNSAAAEDKSKKSTGKRTTAKIDPKKKEEEEQQTVSDTGRQSEEDNYIIVNVMEKLVKERAPEYIRQFGVCGCKRCEMDVEAEALSELPSKYVVINRYAVSPLINFYRTRFAGQVTVEVAKACMAVKSNPRHEADMNGTESADDKNQKKA